MSDSLMPGDRGRKGTMILRPGTPSDVDRCVSVWVEACAVRDGERVAGVAERARPKFDQHEVWIVAEGSGGRAAGFVLATVAGSGQPTDPPTSPVVGLLAVDPAEQGNGLGAQLLTAVTSALTDRGHVEAVLHVLASNIPAVRLYESQGWVAVGPAFDHTLLHRPFQTYLRTLPA